MPIPDAFALPDSVAPRAKQDDLFDAHRALLEVTVWDRVTPINGQPPEYWLGRLDVPAEGDIYLIGSNGHTQIFQPHHPNGGPLAPGSGETVGKDHADRIAAGHVHAILVPANPGGAPHPPEVLAAVHAVATFAPPIAPPHPQPTPQPVAPPTFPAP